MAAVTAAVIGGVGAAVSLGNSVKQISDGKKLEKEGEKALAEFERQDLVNAHEGRQIAREGSELLAEENARNTSSVIKAVRNSGTRGIIGALPKIQAESNNQNREARAYLDEQIIQRDRDIAYDNANIRGIQENRDNQELAGIGNQIQVGRENVYQGFRGVANGISGIAGSISGFSELGGGEEETGQGIADATGGLDSLSNTSKVASGAIGGASTSNYNSILDQQAEQRRRSQLTKRGL